MMATPETIVHGIHLKKGQEHFIFLYDCQHFPELFHTIRRWANRRDMIFNWNDALHVSEAIGRLYAEAH